MYCTPGAFLRPIPAHQTSILPRSHLTCRRRAYETSRRESPPSQWLVTTQTPLSLVFIIVGAQLFVNQIVSLAELLSVDAVVLALIISPIATELPEKLSSVLWVRQGKDALALGNITGAMVFQSCIPVAFGIAFTTWILEPRPLLSVPLLVRQVCGSTSSRGKTGLQRPPLWSTGCSTVCFCQSSCSTLDVRGVMMT